MEEHTKQSERAELIRKAMHRAFSLGSTYWQQADSEYTSQHRKADETQAKFHALVKETVQCIEHKYGAVGDWS